MEQEEIEVVENENPTSEVDEISGLWNWLRTNYPVYDKDTEPGE